MNSKQIISFSFLIVALAIGYYFAIYLPQKNQQQIDLQKQQFDLQQQQVEMQKQKDQNLQKQTSDKKQALNNCLSDASMGYNVEWRSNCRDRGLLPAGCDEATINLSFADYQKQNNLSGMQGWDAYWKMSTQKQDQCTCELPYDLSDRVNADLQQAKDTCFKEYPQN